MHRFILCQNYMMLLLVLPSPPLIWGNLLLYLPSPKGGCYLISISDDLSSSSYDQLLCFWILYMFSLLSTLSLPVLRPKLSLWHKLLNCRRRQLMLMIVAGDNLCRNWCICKLTCRIVLVTDNTMQLNQGGFTGPASTTKGNDTKPASTTKGNDTRPASTTNGNVTGPESTTKGNGNLASVSNSHLDK